MILEEDIMRGLRDIMQKQSGRSKAESLGHPALSTASFLAHDDDDDDDDDNDDVDDGDDYGDDYDESSQSRSLLSF